MKKYLLILLVLASVAFGSITTTNTRVDYSTDNLTVAFTFAFPIISTSDLVVLLRDTTAGTEEVLTEVTDYAVSAVNNDFTTGGTVTTVATHASGSTLTILRDTPDTQQSTLSDSGVLRLAILEDSYDKLTMLVQQLQEQLDRVPYAPRSDATTLTYETPSSVERAGKNMGWDSSGNVVATSVASTSSVSFGAFGTDMAATATALAARGILELDTDDDVQFAQGTFTDVVTKGPYVDVRAFGAIADSGTTDNTTAFVNAIATGKNVYIPFVPGQYYKIIDELTLANANQIIFSDGAEVRQATANKAGFIITASEVEVHGLVIVGTQFAATSGNNEMGIGVDGVDKDSFLSGIKITNCKISSFGDYGIWMEYVDDFNVSHNHIDSIWHAGIFGVSVQRGIIDSNIVTDIVGTVSGHYGIVVTRNPDDSVVTEPRSKDVVISNNTVTNVTSWEGIDAHSGENIAIVGNTIKSCNRGITITGTNNGSAVLTFASLNITIAGNVVDSGVTDGTAGIGIQHAGVPNVGVTAVTEYGTGCITGNTIIGHGTKTSTVSGGISIQVTKGMVVTGNTIIGCSPNGVHVRYFNEGFTVSGNGIIDPWSDTTNGTGVFVDGRTAIGYVGGNSLRIDDTGLGVNVMNIGILVANDTENQVDIGLNNSEAVTYINDAGQKANRGTYSSSVTIGTATTADLASSTLIGNTLGYGKFLKITAGGTLTGSTGNATINLVFGSTTISFRPVAACATEDWKFDAVVEHSAVGAQRISWTAVSGTSALAGYDTAAEDLTGDITVKCTGTLSNGADEIVQAVWVMEKY